MRPNEWIVGRDTGTSSKTIWAVMTGTPYNGMDVPYDPSDFGRCYRLLAHFPEWRERLHEVAEAMPEWGALVRQWDELTTLYEREIKNPDGMAPDLYRRMKDLIEEGRLAAGWENPSPGHWRKTKKEASHELFS